MKFWIISSAVLGGFLLDVGIPFLSNPKYSLDPWDDNIENINLMREKSRHRESVAGRLSGLVFGGISIIITVSTISDASVTSFEGPLLLLVLGLAFFLFSILIGRLHLYRRLWYTIQDKSIIYGLIFLFISVISLYVNILSIPFYIIWATMGALFIFRCFDFKYDFLSEFNLWYRMEASSNYRRIEYLISRGVSWWVEKYNVWSSQGVVGFVRYDASDRLQELNDIGSQKAKSLRNSGYPSLSSVESASTQELSDVPGIGENLAEQIKGEAESINSE